MNAVGFEEVAEVSGSVLPSSESESRAWPGGPEGGQSGCAVILDLLDAREERGRRFASEHRKREPMHKV